MIVFFCIFQEKTLPLRTFTINRQKSLQMKNSLSLFLFSLFMAVTTANVSATSSVLSFPEALGYGAYATGGRGGVVYYVTRLDDALNSDGTPTEGTLRWALTTGDDTPRTVLFQVCGTIYLRSVLKLQHPNVTIAGQTAPGGGICIAGANIYVCKPNVIIRHIRFRAGDIPMKNYPALDVENTRNVIIDHCSFTWSMEECLTLYDTDSTTVQWCIIGEGLYCSKHTKGSRSYATQWGGEHGTMCYCLISNCLNRTPRFNGVRDEADLANGKRNHDAQVVNHFYNNVVFNWGKKNSVYGGENDTTKNHDAAGVPAGYNRVYMRNNYFRAGPATQAANMSERYFAQGSKKGDYGQWYLEGNMFEPENKFNPQKPAWHVDTLAKVNADNLYGYTRGYAYRAFNLDGAAANQDNFDRYILRALPDELAAVATLSASEAFEKVTSSAGAMLPRMDEQDKRMLAEAAGAIDPVFVGAAAPHNTGIIDSPDDIAFSREDYFYINDSVVAGGYPFLDAEEGDSVTLDTDGDGLPDLYEMEIGLDALDGADGAMITPEGYSQLELYLNGVASGAIDKSRYETEPYISQEPDAPVEPESIRTIYGNSNGLGCYDLQGRPLQEIPSQQVYIENGKSKMVME